MYFEWQFVIEDYSKVLKMQVNSDYNEYQAEHDESAM